MGSVSSTSTRCTTRPFGPGLVRDERHAEDLLGDDGGLGGILRDFDAATLAASAGVNLRFDDHAAADVLRGRLGFGDGERHLPARHGDIVFGQDGLGLILVDFHFGAVAAILLVCTHGRPRRVRTSFNLP